MKTILFIWPQLGNHGGGELVLANLLNCLNRYYKIDVLCYENIYNQVLPTDINVFFASRTSNTKIGNLVNRFKLVYKLFILVKKYDLLILNDVPFINIVVWFVTRIMSVKYLIWSHLCRDEMKPNNSMLSKLFYKKSLMQSNGIICVSEYAANSMHNYLFPQKTKIYVIYNIVLRTLANQDKLNLPINVVKICAVGRLTHEKNFALLIDALNLIKTQTRKQFHLYICGEGIERTRLEALIKKYQMNDIITLVGYVTNVMSYINGCDILVSSSDSEALPTVIYEALFCSKSVIVTNTGAAEIVENGKYGIVVDKNNVQQMSQALLELINNDNLRLELQKSAIGALNKFEKENIIQQWTNLIQKICGTL